MEFRDVLRRLRSVRTYTDPVSRDVLDYHERYQSPDKLKITGGRELEGPAPYWYVDAGAAAMTLMLAAIDEGLETAISA